MAVIGLAVLVGHHADDLVALHLGLEGAADAAIGAGGDDAVLGLARLDDRFLDQRRRRAGLHAGAAGDAFGVEEAFVLAGGNVGGEAAPVDGQRERALHFLAGAHAARADDAFRRIEGEIGVRLVLLGDQMIGAVIAVAHFAQAHRAGHVLQFAIAIGRAGQAIERMVGDVELHHALAQRRQARRLGLHLHARLDQRGAGGRRAAPAVDLHQAEPAGTEGLQAVGGAELGNLEPRFHRRTHDRGAGRHAHALAVDLQRHQASLSRAGVP